ncbi:hypothetical protein MASR1M74_06840 [Lentimicrobium sp.]
MENKTIKSGLIISLILLVVAVIFWQFTGKEPDADRQYEESYARDTRFYTTPLPATLDFAGEKVPLDVFYVREGLDREMLVNNYWHSNTMLLLKRAYRYFPMIEAVLKKNGIPDDFKYLALIESGLANVVSPSNAAGFWQFLDKTAQQYGLEVSTEVDERYHAVKATEAACAYLKSSFEIYKNWTLAAASYNAGMGRITRELNRQQVNNYYDLYLNAETTRYVYRIIALKLIYEHPTRYGYLLRHKDMYPPIPTYSVKIDTTIKNLITFAAAQNVNYRLLKEFNPWLRSDVLNVKPGKSYQIDLPLPGYITYSKLWFEMEDADSIFGRIPGETPYPGSKHDTLH